MYFLVYTQGKLKIHFPIYYEEDRPPTAGVPEGIIERQMFLTDLQRFHRDAEIPHQLVDDSPWYLPNPGTWVNGEGDYQL